MDPLSLLAAAKVSYEAIKVGISVGKEMQGMFQDVSSLLDSVGHLTRIAAEPPRPGMFGEKTAEQIAIDAFMAKAEVEKMMAEVKNTFIGEYGIGAWDTILSETIRIKKEQKAAALIAEKERAEFMGNVMLWGSVGLLFFVVVACGLLAAIAFAH